MDRSVSAAEKAALRRRIREHAPDPEALRAESAALCARILESALFREAKAVAAFMPLPGEADIRPVLAACLASGKRLALPATRADLSMTFRLAADLAALTPDAFGIPAPGPEAPGIPAGDLDLMLVPLSAVDARGYRLGKGGGCYDRWLRAHAFRGVTLGVALRHQWVERVPAEAWDIPLERAVTPDTLVIFPENP